ncbi:hypothetical protein L3X38_018359 [Prunus dulcis]|uniref:Integrase zinc-binding domain-containing protein n=1 Tax=Prunus dulcis TaxID=3755 RepID=A0AAD4WAV5_PRUDU|nr:hypothetical protein L3X38_018359 [Prunus dulcis]
MKEFPLRLIVHSLDAPLRLMKWAIKLSQYNLLYRMKTAIKAQALVDFVVKFTLIVEEEKLIDEDLIIDYLVNGNPPTDKSEARKVQQKVARYYMQGNKLITRSYFGPHLTCIKYPQILEVLWKIHDDECGNYSGGWSLTQKILNISYFWPTMRHDSIEYVKRCDRCQQYKPVLNLPTEINHP